MAALALPPDGPPKKLIYCPHCTCLRVPGHLPAKPWIVSYHYTRAAFHEFADALHKARMVSRRCKVRMGFEATCGSTEAVFEFDPGFSAESYGEWLDASGVPPAAPALPGKAR